jgi:LuxR family transcriptional regulator, maltose regulon positive regulatory protein
MVDLSKSDTPRRWITRSKFEMPRSNVRLICRDRLMTKMASWGSIDLGVVVGPAGYAKSTTIAEWCRIQQGHGSIIAWLSLDEADAEPAQFLSYVIASLSAAGIGMQGLEAGAEEGFFAGGIASALTAMMDAISLVAAPVVLVLDDYHRLDSERVDDLLKTFLVSRPSNLSIIVATRNALSFDLGHLLASGRAAELGSDALRFTREELTAVFPTGTSDEVLDLLYQRTEGWPVAVQLAKLLVTDSPTTEHLQNFQGNTGHIATYLTDQIVSGLAPELQQFLCLTSPLESYNAELACAVTQREDARVLMEQLEPLSALVVRIEEKGTTFRYHRLFAEYLQNELHRRNGREAVEGVHRRASLWYETNGYMTDAVKHGRDAGDFDRCAQLVEGAGGWELILFGGIGYLRGLLQHVPESVAQSYPRILLAKAYLSLKDGLLAEARALFDAAENCRGRKEPDESLRRDLLTVGTLIFVYEDIEVSAADIERMERRHTELSGEGPMTRSIVASQLIVSELAIGRFAKADHRIQQTMRTMREARSVLGLNYCFLHAGLAAMYQGRLKAAEVHVGVAMRMAEENFAFDPGLRAHARVLAGCIANWSGDITSHNHDQLKLDLDHVEQYDGWVDIYAAGFVVEADLLESTDDAVERGQRIAHRRGLTRLWLLTEAMALGNVNQSDRGALALKLKQQLPADIWKERPFLWLPFLESRIALGSYFASIDRSRAIEALTEGLNCACFFNANVHAVRLLSARGLLFDLSGKRTQALDDIVEALTIAAPEQIVGPFLRMRGLMPLLRAVTRYAQDSYVDVLVVEFANKVGSRMAAHGIDMENTNSVGLSNREREVLEELTNGRSNKEIARLLDMTEHTVKFHLKNIFTKLGAERRTEAVARAKELRVI